MEAFAGLKAAGKIRHYGVSNLGVGDMQALWSNKAGQAVEANQVLYNLTRRGVEHDLVPWLAQRRVPLMAYSPIEQARLTRDSRLVGFARKHGMTPAQAALAWLLRRGDVIVIPKSSNVERVKEDFSALEIRLDDSQLAELDRLFPPPRGPEPLAML
jgi:diketogulonate reductase-like aldo/keto reductase